ncbi:rhomboid family intramembrane serine protease, partial [Methylopila musalis]
AARRLQGGLAAPWTLSPERRAVLDQIEQAVLRARETGRLAEARGPAPRPIVTLALIAANVAVFGLELWVGGWGGSTDMDVLYDLGALWPPAVLEGGEWSRLFTALFLHYGGLHLALNMVGLLAFGNMLEARAGRIALAVAYLVAGVGSMAGVLAFEAFFATEPTLLVGASGAIFGVVGAYGGLMLRDALRGRVGARRALVVIAAIVALQMVFDFTVPQVSFSAHAFGFVLGAAVGLLLGGRKRTPAKARRPR